MTARFSPVESLRAVLTAIRDDAADLARNAGAARFIGEQVVRQVTVRWCKRPSGARPGSRGQGALLARDAPRRADQTLGAAPVEGYDVLTARQIVEMLADADRGIRDAVFVYESARRSRRTVLEAAASDFSSESPDT